MALRKWLAPGAAMLSAALLIGAGSGISSVSAQQAPPVARVYGSITVNGSNGASGAVVTAYAGTTLCGTSTTGSYNGTQYYVDIPSGSAACSNPGTTLTFQVNGQAATGSVQVPSVSSAVQFNLTVSGGAVVPGAAAVSYQAGWNLVSGPQGMVFSQAASPLYTLTASTGGAYATVPNTQGVTGGQGYWAYFTTPVTVTLSGTAAATATVTAPAGQYIQVGNPSATASVTISGADIAYTYSVAGGYVASTTLAPGQGAWVFSNAGGTITLR